MMFRFEEQVKEKYYQMAEEKLKEAQLEMFRIDRKQITVIKNEKLKVFLVPWSRYDATREELGRLKAIENFVVVRDRYKKAKKGETKQQTELGYFLIDLEEEDR